MEQRSNLCQALSGILSFPQLNSVRTNWAPSLRSYSALMDQEATWAMNSGCCDKQATQHAPPPTHTHTHTHTTHTHDRHTRHTHTTHTRGTHTHHTHTHTHTNVKFGILTAVSIEKTGSSGMRRRVVWCGATPMFRMNLLFPCSGLKSYILISMYRAKPSLEEARTVCALCSDTAVKSDICDWICYGWLSSATVQTGPVAHPVSCTMGTGSFPGGKAAGAWR
jgi:hypothetical protein